LPEKVPVFDDRCGARLLVASRASAGRFTVW